jgi:GDP-L-fucose synthase
MNKNAKIYIAGHRGLVGSAILRALEAAGYENLLTRTRAELDLTRQADVEAFFEAEKPEYVFLAAAVVGGIMANMEGQPAFLLKNLQIECNVIESAYRHGVKKLLFLGSSCIYPREAEQPIAESALLTGPLEPTNEGYAIAKIAGLRLCEYLNRQQGAAFVSVMPCNLYGYNDNFDLKHSHFLPALIRKFHEAKANGEKTVTVWGTGRPYRELLFADDLADACLFVMENYSGAEFLNAGYGEDMPIAEYARLIKEITGFAGEIVYDTAKPDGMFRKIVDSSKLRALGWKPKTSLREGIRLTYEWYLGNIESGIRG